MRSTGPIGKKRNVEALWRDLFSNTSQWFDHRPEKMNPRFPDFKHMQTQESLWLNDARNPPWVQAKLAAIPPGTLQSTVFEWVQRLKRSVKSRQYRETIEAFHQMQNQRICPDPWTFLPVLNACAGLGALEEGRHVHTQIIQVGCESNIFVANCLVDMYAKCRSIEDAWSVFNKLPQRNVVTWNVMIGAYVKSGMQRKAMELFWKMQQEGVEPNAVTFVGMLNACASVAALEEGRRVHEEIIQNGYNSSIQVANCLVDMYAKGGSIGDAWSVFGKMQKHDVVTWNAMIGGYARSGLGLKAMELFRQMQQEGVQPNAITFVGLLNACASVAALEEGRCIHTQIRKVGCESEIHVATSLVDMYAKSGGIEDAWMVFNNMQEHSVVTWNAMIAGYVRSGQGLRAIELFWKMQQEGAEPDTLTFVQVLNACATRTALEEGRRVHQEIIRRGCEPNVYMVTCLVDMYAKCGSIEDAWSVFKERNEHDVVTWNAIIWGYVKSGQGLKAMELFWTMKQEGVEPNTITFLGALNACASLEALEEGRHVHQQIIQRDCQSIVVATCLVDMYARCGSIEDALSVFHEMPEHNVLTCNAMIGSYVKSGQGLHAIELFRQMQQEGVEPDAFTFIAMLNACASVAALEEGRRVHRQIIQKKLESNVYVATCLVHMYAKSGSIETAWNIFHKMQEHDVVTWNAMISGYAMHGQAKKAVELFKRMRREGLKLNGVTFTCLLSACSHGGLVKEGLRYFKSMSYCNNVIPSAEHYACMVDLLGCAGELWEAEALIMTMPLKANVYVWMSLFSACRIHGNIEMAERAAKQCWEYAPETWDRSAAFREERLQRRLGEELEEQGRTWIEVNYMVHSFVVDHEGNTQILQIHAELDRLSIEMNEAGYVPDTRFLLHENKISHFTSPQ